MLSSRTRSAPAPTASRTSSTESHSTSTGRSGYAARTSANAFPTPPAASTWLSLTSAASDRLIRWFSPPPRRTAYFSSARRPGVVLRVSRTAAPEPATASTHRAVAVATPERWQSRLSAVRSAVSSERVGPVTVASTAPRRTRSPSRTAGSTAHPRIDRGEHGRGHRQAGDDPGGAGDQVADRGLVGRHGRHRGHVHPAGQVLGQRPPDEVVHVRRIQPGSSAPRVLAGRSSRPALRSLIRTAW